MTKLKLTVVGIGLAIGMVFVLSHRYTLISRGPSTIKLDRWTGETFVLQQGNLFWQRIFPPIRLPKQSGFRVLQSPHEPPR